MTSSRSDLHYLTIKQAGELIQNQELSEFDAFCQIIENVTSLSEEDVFKFADEEITAIALTIVEQFRKKK